jgi:YebC/PmpR family DNA-binding regulatory protein
MSGHSKWSQIKHKKGIADAKKGATFGKISRAISIAARDNPDPSSNLRLKAEIERARAVNMPSDNIERAIKRVADKSAAALTEIQLELIGPGSAAIVVNAITDNSNRTINELKQIATRAGAHLAGQGAVSWMFKKAGIIRLRDGADEALQLTAIDAGADDVQTDDGSVVVLTAPEKLQAVREALGDAVISASVELHPTTLTPVSDRQQQGQLEALLEALDEHDDVQDVFTNADY